MKFFSSFVVGIGSFEFRFETSRIDERILSPCEWNNPIGLVKRLDNRVSIHAAREYSRWHRSTSNGSLLPAAILA